MHHNEEHHHTCSTKWFLSWKGVAVVLGFAGLSYYLLTVHRTHLAVALPYIILLLCPLMHIFGHRHGNKS